MTAMEVTRREFIKFAAGLGATVMTFAGLSRMAKAKLPSMSGRKWTMIIDLKACNGCKRCESACSVSHFTPVGQKWMRVFEEETASGEKFPLPRPCMNCTNAPCVNVCPVGASFYTEDGVVLIDHRICIGCRMCMAACPYQARSFNWEEPEHGEEEMGHKYSPEEPWPHRKGVPDKCMFCLHRIKKGLLPECVEACKDEMARKGMAPAMWFGDATEGVVSNGLETKKLSDLLKGRQSYRLKEELGTGPSVIYLPR